MGMGFAPTWLRQVSPPASQNYFNHWDERTLGDSKDLFTHSVAR